jgi:hypothetical protein
MLLFAVFESICGSTVKAEAEFTIRCGVPDTMTVSVIVAWPEAPPF